MSQQCAHPDESDCDFTPAKARKLLDQNPVQSKCKKANSIESTAVTKMPHLSVQLTDHEGRIKIVVAILPFRCKETFF